MSDPIFSVQPNPKKILLVDDDPLIIRMYQNKLSHDGYMISLAFNGEEGVVVAKQEMPDLILLDLSMPKVNGLQALQMLKSDATTQNIPVIILTNLGDNQEYLDKSKELGALDYLNKAATDLKTLSDIVARALIS